MQTFSGWEDWTAAGHASSLSDSIALALGLLALAALGFFVLRALLRHGRYRAVGVLVEDELQALRAQIAETERRTKGEIGVVVLEESDGHPQGCWLAALAFVLVTAALVAGLEPAAHSVMLLPALFGSGAIGYFLARALPDLRRAFVTHARAHEMAEEQALQEFAGLGMHRTEGRTGVLILVSLFEQTAVVLADDGIHSKVGQDAWLEATKKVIDGVRAGSLTRGLRGGIESVTEVLAKHCPRAEPHKNELPDHLIVRHR